jgi:quinol monooxygenase YgiN
MVIVGGSFEVEPARRDEYLQGRLPDVATSRSERGCLEYVLSADPLVPGRVVLFERWEDGDCLGEHLQAARAKRATAAPTEGPDAVPVLAAEITRYEISSSGPL